MSKLQMVSASLVLLFATFAPAFAHASGMPTHTDTQTHRDRSPRVPDRGAHPRQG
jgi:hypothetical protein